MKPPFYGTRISTDIDPQQIFDLMDRDVLYSARWQLKGDLSGDEWQRRIDEVAEPAFERLVSLSLSRNLIQPRMVYGHFASEKTGNLLFVRHENRTFKFDFPRERQSPNRCLADFFPDGFVTMMLVTVGNEVSKAGADLFRDNRYTDAFYLKGFAAESAEAVAQHAHRHIAKELGLEEGAGVRFSFGYPSCPNLMDQEKLYKLLGGNRIGVVLSRTMHLIPEHSTSAVVSFAPDASRFIP